MSFNISYILILGLLLFLQLYSLHNKIFVQYIALLIQSIYFPINAIELDTYIFK